MANKTKIVIPSQGSEFEVPGVNLTETQVRTLYASEIPQIANMTATTTSAATADGTVTTITFAPRTGAKG